MRSPELDLDTIDAALAAGRVTTPDPEERELQELALLLRAGAPAPDDDFAALLDRRVAEGFPRPRASAPNRFRDALRRLRERPLPALAAASSALVALVALVVSVSLVGGGSLDSDRPAPTGGAGSAPMEIDGRPQSRAVPPGGTVVAPEPPAQDGIAPNEPRRRVERSAALTLAAPEERLDSVAAQIARLAERREGFVLRSSLTTGDEGTTGGSFELRIPASSLEPTLQDLARLGTVRSRTQSGDDVTRAYVSVSDRLAAASAERRGLLRRLERADSNGQAAALRTRLNLVSAELRALRSELRALRERTNYARVSVTLEADGVDAGGAGNGTGEALDDALGSLVGAFNLALRVLGVALPLALLGGLAWLVAAAVRRRRREAALT